MSLKKIKELKREEQVLKETKTTLKLDINAARRKIYAKYNNTLKKIDNRLVAIEENILDLCDLIK